LVVSPVLTFPAAIGTVTFPVQESTDVGHESNPQEKMPPWKPWKIEGNLKIVVLPTEFSDKKHSIELNIINQHMDEMKNYYEEVSHGKVTLMWTLGQEWKILRETMDYYGEEAKHGVDKNFEVLVEDSLDAWSEVTYRAYEYVIVVHAGPDQSDTGRDNDIWSACYNSNGHTKKLAHARFGTAALYIWGVAVVSEFSKVGTFAHEFGHALGLPDLYNTRDRSDFVGDWSLMDHGSWLGTPKGSQPSYLEAWSQIHLGWITYEQWMPNQTARTWQIDPLESGDGIRAIKIPVSRFTYYLVEVRKRIGFDRSLPSEGVLITFIDYTMNSGEGIVKAVDSEPETETLDDAVFSVGETFSDQENNIYVTVLDQAGNGYEVSFSNVMSTYTITTKTEAVTATVTARSTGTYSESFERRTAPSQFLESVTIAVILILAVTGATLALKLKRRRTIRPKESILRRPYCIHCGAQIPPDSKYCSSCGRPQ